MREGVNESNWKVTVARDMHAIVASVALSGCQTNRGFTDTSMVKTKTNYNSKWIPA